ncbi:MAG: ketopantoate reductase family protein [Lutibacter sp.]
MKILIYGAGGVGGYFGAKLAQAGNDVTFIARGKHLTEIQKNGLKVKSIKGNFSVNVTAIDEVDKIKDQPDLVIFGVKSWQLIEAAKNCLPLVHSKIVFLPLQNGANNCNKLLKVLPKENIICGLCRIVSKIESPGVINHFEYEPEIVLGEITNQKTKRILAIKDVLTKAEIQNKIPENIQLAVWRKFLFIATFSGIAALTRSTIGEILKSKYLKKMMQSVAEEIVSIAQIKKINLTEKDIKKSFEIYKKLEPNTTASMQRDLMEGKPSELENFNGYIVKLGQQLKIKTPINELVYYALLPQEELARKLI